MVSLTDSYQENPGYLERREEESGPEWTKRDFSERRITQTQGIDLRGPRYLLCTRTLDTVLESHSKVEIGTKGVDILFPTLVTRGGQKGSRL